MKVIRVLLSILLAVSAVSLTGCKKADKQQEQPEVEITEENMEAELDKLESELNSDIESE